MKDQGSVARVDTTLLNVLSDGVRDHVASVGNSVDVDLLCTLKELGNHDRRIVGYLSRRLRY